MEQLKAFATRHPAVALLGFLPPVWLVGCFWVGITTIKAIRQAERQSELYHLELLYATRFLTVFWPLAVFDELLELKRKQAHLAEGKNVTEGMY